MPQDIQLFYRLYIRPHLNRYWLGPAYEADFDVKVSDINERYKQAPELAKQGQRIESTDEMSGVQALERKHPDLLMSPLAFMFNFDSLTGQLAACTARQTRNEPDFLEPIQGRVPAEPQTRQWHFVSDNLNIHISESLVRYVAEESDLAIDLGLKGKSAILKSIGLSKAKLLLPNQLPIYAQVEGVHEIYPDA